MGYSTMSALGSLAFVVFDPTKNSKVVETYHTPLDWTGQEGREINPNRLKQLLASSTVTRRVLCSDEPAGLPAAVAKLVSAINKYKVKVLWMYPTDLGMFTNLCMHNGIKPPWSGVSLRDPNTAYKTGLDLGIGREVKRGEFEPEDHALGDASYISRLVRSVYGVQTDSPATKETNK
jgi:hypothetical protein